MFAKIKKFFQHPEEKESDSTIVGANQGETNSTTLPDGRTATVSVREDGSSASFHVE